MEKLQIKNLKGETKCDKCGYLFKNDDYVNVEKTEDYLGKLYCPKCHQPQEIPIFGI